MDNVDPPFHIFGDELPEPNANDYPDVEEVPPLAQGNGAAARLNWTPLMSARVLEKFSNLVCEGVRTDKGFKECHLNAVAKDLQAFIQQPVTGVQVYNHLRKWRLKWVKICRLRELSAALWDDDLCMISLDASHYNGHVKVRHDLSSCQFLLLFWS